MRGDGEGGEITLSNVIVNAATRGSGISIALHDAVLGYKVLLRGSANITKSPANDSTTYSSIKIELRGNTTGNYIQFGNVYVSKCRVVPGSAFSIEVTDKSQENVILLQKVHLLGSNSSEVSRRGLQVTVTGRTKRNEIHVTGIVSWFHRALALWSWGYIEFSEHAMGNLVVMRSGNNGLSHDFTLNHALRGGGTAVAYMDFATQNIFKALDIRVFNGSAKQGGGVYFVFQNSSTNNSIHLTQINLSNNIALCGGGMFIQIQDSSVANSLG